MEKIKARNACRHFIPPQRIVRRRKHEFSAILVKEAGKPWNEADADTAEAIDFMEYYGRQMLKLKDGIPVESRPIEYNRFSYIPLE